MITHLLFFFFFSSRRRHTRCSRDWSSDVCSSDLGRCERHPDDRLKKRTGFGSHPGERKTQARCGWDVSSASTFRRHVQLLKPQDTATIQKEMAWSVSPFR